MNVLARSCAGCGGQYSNKVCIAAPQHSEAAPVPCAGLIREPIDYSYEACMEESRLVMLTCAKGAMKAANISPREARPLLGNERLFKPSDI